MGKPMKPLSTTSCPSCTVFMPNKMFWYHFRNIYTA